MKWAVAVAVLTFSAFITLGSNLLDPIVEKIRKDAVRDDAQTLTTKPESRGSTTSQDTDVDEPEEAVLSENDRETIPDLSFDQRNPDPQEKLAIDSDPKNVKSEKDVNPVKKQNGVNPLTGGKPLESSPKRTESAPAGGKTVEPAPKGTEVPPATASSPRIIQSGPKGSRLDWSPKTSWAPQGKMPTVSSQSTVGPTKPGC